jgi:hypothetical protein
MLELIIVAGLVVLAVSMYFKFKEKPVDMNHQAPNVHNVQMSGRVGPAPAKKVAKKKKKTTKKKAVKK